MTLWQRALNLGNEYSVTQVMTEQSNHDRQQIPKYPLAQINPVSRCLSICHPPQQEWQCILSAWLQTWEVSASAVGSSS